MTMRYFILAMLLSWNVFADVSMDLYKRSELNRPLTNTEIDYNWTQIENQFLGFMSVQATADTLINLGNGLQEVSQDLTNLTSVVYNDISVDIYNLQQAVTTGIGNATIDLYDLSSDYYVGNATDDVTVDYTGNKYVRGLRGKTLMGVDSSNDGQCIAFNSDLDRWWWFSAASSDHTHTLEWLSDVSFVGPENEAFLTYVTGTGWTDRILGGDLTIENTTDVTDYWYAYVTKLYGRSLPHVDASADGRVLAYNKDKGQFWWFDAATSDHTHSLAWLDAASTDHTHTLDWLSNVAVSSPSHADFLHYDATSGNWENVDLTGDGYFTFEKLRISGLWGKRIGSVDSSTDGKFLLYNNETGTYLWKNSPVPAYALDDLTDVTITGIADNEILVYDGNLSTWANVPPSGDVTNDLGKFNVVALRNKALPHTDSSADGMSLSYNADKDTMSWYPRAATDDHTHTLDWLSDVSANTITGEFLSYTGAQWTGQELKGGLSIEASTDGTDYWYAYVTKLQGKSLPHVDGSADGYCITYNKDKEQFWWKNAVADVSLDTITGVNVTGSRFQDILIFDGSEWVNALVYGDVSVDYFAETHNETRITVKKLDGKYIRGIVASDDQYALTYNKDKDMMWWHRPTEPTGDMTTNGLVSMYDTSGKLLRSNSYITVATSGSITYSDGLDSCTQSNTQTLYLYASAGYQTAYAANGYQIANAGSGQQAQYTEAGYQAQDAASYDQAQFTLTAAFVENTETDLRTYLDSSHLEVGTVGGTSYASINMPGFFEVIESTDDPENPAANYMRIFAMDNGGVTKLYALDSAGNRSDLTDASGGPETLSLSNLTDVGNLTSSEHDILVYAGGEWKNYVFFSPTPPNSDLVFYIRDEDDGPVLEATVDGIYGFPVPQDNGYRDGSNDGYCLAFDVRSDANGGNHWAWKSCGGTGGASALNALTDVTIAGPAADQIIMYNDGTNQWSNTGVSGDTSTDFGYFYNGAIHNKTIQVKKWEATADGMFLSYNNDRGGHFNLKSAGSSSATLQIVQMKETTTDGLNAGYSLHPNFASKQTVRRLNSVIVNTITSATTSVNTRDASESDLGNYVSLPAGNYEVEGFSTAGIDAQMCQLVLYNATDSSVTVAGGVVQNDSFDAIQSMIPIRGYFTLAGTKTLQFRQACSGTVATTESGSASAGVKGASEVYSSLTITKM